MHYKLDLFRFESRLFAIFIITLNFFQQMHKTLVYRWMDGCLVVLFVCSIMFVYFCISDFRAQQISSSTSRKENKRKVKVYMRYMPHQFNQFPIRKNLY